MAWRVFSIHIRKRDRTPYACVRCATCPRIEHWQAMDAGHFFSRIDTIIRFRELNVHGPCKRCHMDLHGHHDVYKAAMERMFGPAMIEELTKPKDSAPFLQESPIQAD
jgi:hypothetical protein